MRLTTNRDAIREAFLQDEKAFDDGRNTVVLGRPIARIRIFDRLADLHHASDGKYYVYLGRVQLSKDEFYTGALLGAWGHQL